MGKLPEVENAGVDFVIDEFEKRGFQVTRMGQYNKGYDLTVRDASGLVFHVEVKSTNEGKAKPDWKIQRHHRYANDPRRVYAMVELVSLKPVALYLMPCQVVATHLDAINTAYDQRNPTAKAARPYKIVAADSFVPAYRHGWLNAYRNNWNVITTR